MANANDPTTIQYVIQEDGFWYVASKDRTPGVPEITVSTKGVANGLSTEYNDGFDFGPDSYNPSITSGVPLTQTSGIQEANDYLVSISLNGKISSGSASLIELQSGVFYVSKGITLGATSDRYGYAVIIGLQGAAANFLTTSVISTTPQFPAGTPLLTFNAAASVCYLSSVGLTTNVGIPSYYIYSAPENPSTGHISNVYFGDYPSEGVVNLSLSSYSRMFFNSCHFVITSSVTTTYGLGIIQGSNNATVTFTNCQLHGGNGGFTLGTPGTTGGGAPSVFVINSPFVMTGTDEDSSVGANTVPLFTAINNVQFIKISNLYVYSGYIVEVNSGSTISHLIIEDILMDTNNSSNGGINIVTNAGNILNLIVKNINFNNLTPTSGYTKIVNNTGTINYVDFNNLVNINGNYPPDVINTPTIPTNPPVSATVYQNTNPYDIRIYLPVYATTSGTAGTVAYGEDASSTVTEMTPKFISGSTSSTSVEIVDLVVPAGHYFEFTGTGVTFGTATVKAA